ncbi:hypothetical protein ACFE04_012333 [Oxalis oulophora]
MIEEFDNYISKKRRWEDTQVVNQDTFEKKLKEEGSKQLSPIFDIELHLETPLPSEWQRCLDIQSGKIHFYNTRTEKRTSKDPRLSADQPSDHKCLDLELNLTSDPQRKKKESSYNHFADRKNSSKDLSDLLMGGDHEHEMIATVCVQCHLLVMMCKSTPACPNCKFMHPPQQTTPKLFMKSLSTLLS